MARKDEYHLITSNLDNSIEQEIRLEFDEIYNPYLTVSVKNQQSDKSLWPEEMFNGCTNKYRFVLETI